MKNYNTTQLDPKRAFERHVFHRDQFAHYLRWTHVLKTARRHDKVLDVGCGSGNLYLTLLTNRFAPARYLGLDIRPQTVKANKLKYPKAEFQVQDLTAQYDTGKDWDLICSFEVAEHVGKQHLDAFLGNIANQMAEKTMALLSTPCYDEQVGAADNHTYDSGDGRGKAPQEFTYAEFKAALEKHFVIEQHWGTFASQKAYESLLTPAQRELYDKLHEYYDQNLVSVIFAPLFPDRARNVLWRLRKRP